MTGRGAPERGSGTVLAVGIIAVLLTLLVAVGTATGYVVEAHRARGAADLAALAGAVAFRATADPTAACRAAGASADANAVGLSSCAVTGDRLDFVVAVEAERAVARSLPALPPTVRARGYAGPATS